MAAAAFASWTLAREARALLARLHQVQPFVLRETMVPAAALSTAAQSAIEQYMSMGRRAVAEDVRAYLRWLEGPGRFAPPAEMQRRFTLLRLRFNVVLTQFDLFAITVTQRSEHDTGVWLAGMDVVAEDGLRLDGGYFEAPPVVCYLDRGMGAAIRRARTRLPGGGANPVAVIRMPRERMVGCGIAASLFHEIGHEASERLGLVRSLRPFTQGMMQSGDRARAAWWLWDRWLPEILPDYWALASLGICATLGVMGVVSLPRAFVFRLSPDDPHPCPWIRVKLSCAMGRALFPHPQWDRTERLWEALYPKNGLVTRHGELLDMLQSTLPGFVGLLVHHRPASLRGASLAEVLPVSERQPAALSSWYDRFLRHPALLPAARPSLVMAAIGQARASGKMTPEQETALVCRMLTHWALRETLHETPASRLALRSYAAA